MNKSIIRRGKPFINKNAALLAFQAAQLYFAQSEYLTTSTIDAETNRIELTVHFKMQNYPIMPNGYKYSDRELTTQTYFYEDNIKYIRCATYIFRYLTIEKYQELIKELKNAGITNATQEQYEYLCEMLIQLRNSNQK